MDRKGRAIQGWDEIIARLDGPLHFRFIIQPSMGLILPTIDGVKDAKLGNPAHFWALLAGSGHRKELLKDGWKSICKVFFLAMVLEATYQVITDHHLEFRGTVLVVAFALAICPYLLLRGPTNQLVARLRKSQGKGASNDSIG